VNDMVEAYEYLEQRCNRYGCKIMRLQANIDLAIKKLNDCFILFPRDRNKSDELIHQSLQILQGGKEGSEK